MRIRGIVLYLTLCGVVISGARAQEAKSAAAVTASGRSMAVAFDGIFGGTGRGDVEERTIYLLIDPGDVLKKAAFVGGLRTALRRHALRLAKTVIGVAGVGVRGAVTLKPTADFTAVVGAVRALLVNARDDIRNVYADLRVVAGQFSGAKGSREIVLVALQNGDAEDNVEQTARALRRNDVIFRCITSESYLADSYWSARPYARKPNKTKLTGGDSAFVDLPWGWLFQLTVANEVAPSGYAAYGLSRLARATNGRMHIYAAPDSSRHQCAIYGGCLFCDGDHAPSVDVYWRARMGRFAPSTDDRAKVLQSAGSDPHFRAMLKAWQSAARAGLLRGTPSVRFAGNGLAEQRSRVRAVFNYSGTNLASLARRATSQARECARILSILERTLKGLSQSKGIPRHKATAEYTRLMLQLTKVNLVTFAGWCREIAPLFTGKTTTTSSEPHPDPRNRGRRPSGVSFTNYCLCHGVGPFDAVDLPGGAVLRKELARLRTIADRFEQLYGHTPLGVAVHRSGIAVFHLTYPGIVTKVRRKRPKSRHDKDPVTERGRPTRPGRSSAGTGGPKTGK